MSSNFEHSDDVPPYSSATERTEPNTTEQQHEDLSIEQHHYIAGTKRRQEALESRKARRLERRQEVMSLFDDDPRYFAMLWMNDYDSMTPTQTAVARWIGDCNAVALSKALEDPDRYSFSRSQLNEQLIVQARALSLTVSRLMLNNDTKTKIAHSIVDCEEPGHEVRESNFKASQQELRTFQHRLRILAREPDVGHPLLSAFDLTHSSDDETDDEDDSECDQ